MCLEKNGGFYANPSTFNGRNKAIMTDEIKEIRTAFFTSSRRKGNKREDI